MLQILEIAVSNVEMKNLLKNLSSFAEWPRTSFQTGREPLKWSKPLPKRKLKYPANSSTDAPQRPANRPEEMSEKNIPIK